MSQQYIFPGVEPHTIDLIKQYLQLVLRENKNLNLTRITDFDQAWIYHIEDSLTGLSEVSQAPDGPYADLGCGGGFPGVPLTLATKRNATLVDSSQKKISAISKIYSQLNTQTPINFYAGRAEELARDKHGYYSVITARAMTSLPALLELSSPLLTLSGRLITYKGDPENSEVEWAQGLEDKLGMRQISKRSFTLSDNKSQRTILVYEKVSEPLVVLPRRPGMAQKRPYKPTVK